MSVPLAMPMNPFDKDPRCCKANAAIYEMAGGVPFGRHQLQAFSRQFGLERLDNNLRAYRAPQS